jgi:biopolymer transport protein ExbB/TolQ
MNIHEDLTFRNMNNGNSNSRDNLEFNNLNNSNSRDNLRFNSQNNSPRRKFSSRKDKSKDHRFRNHNTHSLKKNLKERMQSIESRMTRSLKTLPSIISVG